MEDEEIAFTITVSNTGDVLITNARASSTLNPGWSETIPELQPDSANPASLSMDLYRHG